MKASALLVTLALTLGLSATRGPALAQSAPTLQIKYTKFTLPNGLTVILHEDHTVPIATVNMWYHVGSANEKPGRTGFAHLFEHLMFEGTPNAPKGVLDRVIAEVLQADQGAAFLDELAERRLPFLSEPAAVRDVIVGL